MRLFTDYAQTLIPSFAPGQYDFSIIVLSFLAAVAALCLAISGRRKIESELKETIKRQQLIFDYIGEGIYGVDLNGHTIFGNKAAEEMLGYSLEEMLHKSQHDLIHHHYGDGTPYPKERCNIYQAFKDGKVHKEEKEVFWRKDGTGFPVEYSSAPIRNGEGIITGAVVIFRDITKRRQVDEQLKNYASQLEYNNKELALARQEAVNTTRLKSEFLANMSHEIRTPMNGVIGMTNLLLDTDLDARQKNYAHTAIHSAEALLEIVNDILDFSKIEAGKMELESIEFDFQSLAEEVMDVMAAKSREKGLELLLRYMPGTPRHVVGDPGRVRQILFNLISNAIKFTQKGYVSVTIQASMEKEGLHYVISVEDSGIGIPADKLDYIFNKFTQADGSTTRKFGGTGLGLAICKQLAFMMSGEVKVESTLGKGSIFHLTMRLKADDTVPEGKKENLSYDVLKNARILLVDDNEKARLFVEEQLAVAGAEIFSADSGGKALHILKNQAAAEQPIQAVILDYRMPDMDAMELIQRIKAIPALKDTPCILLTSAPQRGDRKRMEDAGFSGYLSKPVHVCELSDMLACIIKSPADTRGKLLTRFDLRERQPKKNLRESNIRFSQVRLLLAEDNPVNQQIIKEVLTKVGVDVTLTVNGEEAVAAFKQDSFDIVLMDCQMPVLDGYEATTLIRTYEREYNLTRKPIIAVTGNVMKSDQEKCLASGMDDFILKPFRRGDLEKKLLQWLPLEHFNRHDVNVNAILPDNPAIDPAMFKQFCDVMGDDIEDILHKYIANANELMALLKQSLEAKDADTIIISAHSLKSTSHQIGALAFKNVLAEIEAQARQGNSESIAPLMAQAGGLLSKVSAAIASLRE